MHKSVNEWAREWLSEADLMGAQVLEVGSRNVNGSLRGYVEGCGSATYTGVDIVVGNGVDLVMDAGSLLFDDYQFDVVIATEMLEHCRDWRAAVSEMKRVTATGGLILVTTRSQGFPVHEPPDYWRFTISDLEAAFEDCGVIVSEKDPEEPGVFILLDKPTDFDECDTSLIFPRGAGCLE